MSTIGAEGPRKENAVAIPLRTHDPTHPTTNITVDRALQVWWDCSLKTDGTLVTSITSFTSAPDRVLLSLPLTSCHRRSLGFLMASTLRDLPALGFRDVVQWGDGALQCMAMALLIAVHAIIVAAVNNEIPSATFGLFTQSDLPLRVARRRRGAWLDSRCP